MARITRLESVISAYCERMSRLNRTDKTLCATYAGVAIAALVGTQIALVRHIQNYDGNVVSGFLKDAVANPAATFGAIDLLAVAVAVLVFVIVEGRRLKMRFLWVYVVLTFVVAISVAFPSFLFFRQRRLAEQRTG